MKKPLLILFVLCLLGFWGCKKIEQQAAVTPQVPILDNNQQEALQYLETFRSEAQLRGLNLNVKNVRFKFEDLLSKGYWGFCNNSQTDANGKFLIDLEKPVNISLDPQVWKAMSNLEKEWLVFHECGHCVLGRIHLNQTFGNGESASIMSAGDAGVYGGNNAYHGFKKEYYVNELFKSDGKYKTNTPVPFWASFDGADYHNGKKKTVFVESFDSNKNRWPDGENAISGGYYAVKNTTDKGFKAPFAILPNTDYEVEFEVKNTSDAQLISFAFGGSVASERVSSLISYKEQALFFGIPELPILNLFATLYDRLQPDKFNKISIRKINDKLYYYVNKQPFYITTAPKFSNNDPLWFLNTSATAFYIDNVVYSTLE